MSLMLSIQSQSALKTILFDIFHFRLTSKSRHSFRILYWRLLDHIEDISRLLINRPAKKSSYLKSLPKVSEDELNLMVKF